MAARSFCTPGFLALLVRMGLACSGGLPLLKSDRKPLRAFLLGRSLRGCGGAPWAGVGPVGVLGCATALVASASALFLIVWRRSIPAQIGLVSRMMTCWTSSLSKLLGSFSKIVKWCPRRTDQDVSKRSALLTLYGIWRKGQPMGNCSPSSGTQTFRRSMYERICAFGRIVARSMLRSPTDSCGISVSRKTTSALWRCVTSRRLPKRNWRLRKVPSRGSRRWTVMASSSSRTTRNWDGQIRASLRAAAAAPS
mmetsp:Transcript_34272/g.108064  ORF Transcript_34272/g.108064 Transcript_34272/m.108064 type:complete len:252 (-) Transcript_34272:1311-2066(-)